VTSAEPSYPFVTYWRGRCGAKSNGHIMLDTGRSAATTAWCTVSFAREVLLVMSELVGYVEMALLAERQTRLFDQHDVITGTCKYCNMLRRTTVALSSLLASFSNSVSHATPTQLSIPITTNLKVVSSHLPIAALTPMAQRTSKDLPRFRKSSSLPPTQ
jgi:hypothetical protein